MDLLKQPYKTLDGIENYFPSLYGEVDNNQLKRYSQAFEKFKKIYAKDCAYIASSSGRVEVIGNHTDHNGGKVVSSAISLDTLAFFLPNKQNLINIYSEYSEGFTKFTVDLSSEAVEKIGTTQALVRGVVQGFLNKGYKVGGFDAYITSSVLGGAGISSSASFEVLISEILNFLYNDGRVTCEEKSIISQYSENVFFGKPCGLLDQTAIAYGGLKMLDFSDEDTIKVTDIKTDLDNFTFVLINTGGSHSNLTDEYASIPREMKEVASKFGKKRLIEISKNEFLNNVSKLCTCLSDRAVLRAIHFYNENERVDKLVKAFAENDYSSFIKIVKASGMSSMVKLQNCYVSGSTEQPIPKALSLCEEFLDNGANRVHGGGFAGTILNVVENSYLSQFISSVSNLFGKENIIPLKIRKVGTIVL